MIVLLWHHKQKKKAKTWTTLLQVLVSALVGGAMIVIILATVKTNDAVSFLHNIEKGLSSKGVEELNELNGKTTYYKMEESLYLLERSKVKQKLKNTKVNIFSKRTL